MITEIHISERIGGYIGMKKLFSLLLGCVMTILGVLFFAPLLIAAKLYAVLFFMLLIPAYILWCVWDTGNDLLKWFEALLK